MRHGLQDATNSIHVSIPLCACSAVVQRLQQNQAEIARQQQLRQTLANEQVELGARNIASTSGTIKAITEQNFVNFMQDENADNLNFLGKRKALELENQQVDVKKRSEYISETANFIKQVEGTVTTIMGTSGGGMGYSGTGAYSQPSLLDGLPNMNLNR